MQDNIARWKNEIEARKMLASRGSADKDWMTVDAPDGSILQVRILNVYIRVVWNDTREDPYRPFAFFRLEAKNSEEFPENELFPKNEFMGNACRAQFLSAVEVEQKIFGAPLTAL